jgi:hypothetical protein
MNKNPFLINFTIKVSNASPYVIYVEEIQLQIVKKYN